MGELDTEPSEGDAERLLLLDRFKDRVGLDLDRYKIEWTTLPDGAEALLVDGAGFDGGAGCFIANAGPDLHVVGSLAPLVPGHVDCIVVRPDGSRFVGAVMPDRWRRRSGGAYTAANAAQEKAAKPTRIATFKC